MQTGLSHGLRQLENCDSCGRSRSEKSTRSTDQPLCRQIGSQSRAAKHKRADLGLPLSAPEFQLSSSSAKPANGIFKKFVLIGVGENFVAVAHVHVKHAVARIGPDNGKVAAGDAVLEANRIVRGIESEQDSYVLVEGGAGVADVPLVCRLHERGGKIARDRGSAIVHKEVGGGWRPVGAVENGPTE